MKEEKNFVSLKIINFNKANRICVTYCVSDNYPPPPLEISIK